MASTDSQSSSDEQVDQKVPLRVMVDKEKKRVLWAEAGKDFVDVLFSFLTLPLGTIARLVSQKLGESVNIGSLSSLYKSMEDLKEEQLWSETYKEMLLFPRNSMEGYCNKLKLNIDDTPMQFFYCGYDGCNLESALLSIFRNQKCSYGNTMEKEVSEDDLSLGNGFVKETTSFIISDDLNVMPNAFGTSVRLLHKFGVRNFEAIDEQTIDISKKEVIDLLALSFLSNTPLTDLILKKKQFHDYSNPINQSYLKVQEVPSNEDRKMSIKVTLRKSTGEILFAEGEPDFADFLLSFLTIPLGGALHMLDQASSSLICIENLYKSLTELIPDYFVSSNDLKEKLVNPQCFPKFVLRNQILPIGEALLPDYYRHTYYKVYGGGLYIEFAKEKVFSHYHHPHYPEKFVQFKLVDPIISNPKTSGSGEFVKGPSLYMVTKDLIVTPMSSVSAISYLNRLQVPLSDLEERVIQIGMTEGLCLLKASLMTTSALTNGLKQFISTVKEEK